MNHIQELPVFDSRTGTGPAWRVHCVHVIHNEDAIVLVNASTIEWAAVLASRYFAVNRQEEWNRYHHAALHLPTRIDVQSDEVMSGGHGDERLVRAIRSSYRLRYATPLAEYTIETAPDYQRHFRWNWRADEYDGPGDNRCGSARTIEECLLDIDRAEGGDG